MCKPRRRKSFVLVEVLIATSLFAVLLTAIFGIFWRSSKLSQAITNKRLLAEQILLVETRLQTIFSTIGQQEVFRPYFYIEPSRQNGSPNLVFTFDNNFHIDDFYSTIALGKLYVENEKLYLGIWPHPKKPNPVREMRKELLLENVTNFSIELFAEPQSKEENETEPEKGIDGPRPGQWTTIWTKEYQAIPAMIKLTVEQKLRDKPIDLWFIVPSEIKIIPYDNKG